MTSQFRSDNFEAQLEAFVDQMIGEVHTAYPGEIVSVSMSGGSLVASVRGAVDVTTRSGDTLAAPVIDNVPVVRMASAVGGGKAAVLTPVMPGDGCLIVCTERSTDGWMAGGRDEGDPRHHDMTDAVAVVGLNRPGVVTQPDNESVWVMFAGGSVQIAPSGDVTIISTTMTRVESPNVQIDAADTTITGNCTVDGVLSFHSGLVGDNRLGGDVGTIVGTLRITGGDVLTDGISAKGHQHSDPQGGNVGPPQ